MLRFKVGTVEFEVSSDDLGALGQHDDGRLELGDKISGLLVQHGVVDEQVVVQALLDSEFGANLILESSDGEGKSRVTSVHLIEESSGFLGLQLVPHVDFSLVDGGPHFGLLGLSFSGGNENVEGDNITRGEFELFHLVLSVGLSDNAVVSVDKVLFEFVGKHSLHSVALEFFADSVNSLGYFAVFSLLLDRSESGLLSVVGGEHDVGFSSVYLFSANYNGMGGLSDIPVNVATEVNFSDISGDELLALIRERREVSSGVVH